MADKRKKRSRWQSLLMAWIIGGTFIIVVLMIVAVYQANRIFAREYTPDDAVNYAALAQTKSADLTITYALPESTLPSATPTTTLPPTQTPIITQPSATITETPYDEVSPTPTPSIAPEILTANAQYRLNMYTGPSTTYQHVGVLPITSDVEILERNNTGTWIRVREMQSRGDVQLEGWVVSGYMAFHAEFQFDVITSTTNLSDGRSEAISSALASPLYDIPIISGVSEQMREVYARGQELGNHSNTVTRIGDSIISNRYYLALMNNAEDPPRLGAYAYLQDTLDYFGPNMTESLSAIIGLSTVSVFDPMWTPEGACEPNEAPMACEYRVRRPSVAFILFGHNDVRGLTGDEYRANLTRIVEESMAQGVIPVLMTFSSHPEANYYRQTLEFNTIIADIADQYHVPLINLWLAARILPEYGLDVDHIHLRNSGFTYMKYDNGEEARSGVALLNLLSLRMLDELRVTLGMDE